MPLSVFSDIIANAARLAGPLTRSNVSSRVSQTADAGTHSSYDELIAAWVEKFSLQAEHAIPSALPSAPSFAVSAAHGFCPSKCSLQ